MGELEVEEQRTRSGVATYLRRLADQLDAGGPVTLELGDRRATVDPTDEVTFKLEGESDWTEGEGSAKQSIEFEMVWYRDVESAADATLSVERRSK